MEERIGCVARRNQSCSIERLFGQEKGVSGWPFQPLPTKLIAHKLIAHKLIAYKAYRSGCLLLPTCKASRTWRRAKALPHDGYLLRIGGAPSLQAHEVLAA